MLPAPTPSFHSLTPADLTPAQIADYQTEPMVAYLLNKHRDNAPELQQQLLHLGRQLLSEGRLVEAWKVLLINNIN